MGRWLYSNRYQTIDCKSLDLQWMNKQKMLENGSYPFQTITWDMKGEKTGAVGIIINKKKNMISGINFQYTYTNHETGDQEEMDYEIKLVTTKCNYGGFRYWFKCPLVVNGRYCGRRVRALYLPPFQKYFGCRHCYNLVYPSQRINRQSKLYFLDKLFERDKKITKLRAEIKTPIYNGRPTKKFKKLILLDDPTAYKEACEIFIKYYG